MKPSNNLFSKLTDKRWWLILIVGILIILGAFSDWILEWLWMRDLNYATVFWTIKETQFALLILAFIVAGLYLLVNFRLFAKKLRSVDFSQTPLENLRFNPADPAQYRSLRFLFSTLAVVIAAMFALAFFSQWDTYFRFHFNEMVGQTDPVFGNDLGYYLFRLPFIQLAQNSLSVLTFLASALLTVGYILTGQIQVAPGSANRIAPFIRRQLSANASLWLLTVAWGFYLQRYELLYDTSGVVFGAGYTDIHVKLPVLWIVFVLVLLLAIAVGLMWFYTNMRRIIYGGVGVLLLSILGLNILPGLVQKFLVEPNELQLETPYIKNNIKLTRQAYRLDEIKEYSYDVQDTLTPNAIQNNQATLNNIRLWDPRLLIQTYRQLQEIRLYYQFYNVDVDRYHTDKGYRQMMLAGRELATDMPRKSDTWVNRHLQYTHGYGLVMNAAAQEGKEGVPSLVIKDIPPVADEGLKVDQAAIYYGEHDKQYRIVNSGIKELNYPKGDDNVYTNYTGTGGIPIGNYFKKLLFAWELGDINILLSDYVHYDSRIQLWQAVQTRIRKIAPFLKLDQDPYLTLIDGKLYWIQDAYTTSPDFPYSESYHGQFNYIRNSVKVVVDAYNGSVKFYAVDQDDPILDVYEDIFPDLFHPLSEMSEAMRKHIRYPQDIFEIQLEMYNTYHMTDPQVFYNNEDLWTRATEKYAGQSIMMDPYYILSKLPNENRLQYLQISPMTPNNRDNMIAWMAARSDMPDYGDLVVYKLPKERLIYGPSQVEAKIDQDPEISRQLSLWDQRGSKVIRGNLMVIPIENSFLYVEPVFLIAEGLDIPQLQRVIVTFGDKIAMQPNLDLALQVIFGNRQVVAQPTETPTQSLVTPQLQKLQQVWQQAQDAMKAGNWTALGKAMDRLKELISTEMSDQTTARPDSSR